MLDGNVPDKLTSNIWDKLLPTLKDSLEEKIISSASSAFISGDYKALKLAIATDKPSHISDEIWENIRKKLGDLYISSLISAGLKYSWGGIDLLELKIALNMLETETRGLKNGTRKQASWWLRTLYFAGLLDGLIKSLDKARYLATQDTSILSPAHLTLLQEMDEIRKKEAEIDRTRLVLISREKQAESACAESRALKEKILRQLEIIDRVIKDPAEILKIEEYENAFSEGNLQNIRTLAQKLLATNIDAASIQSPSLTQT